MILILDLKLKNEEEEDEERKNSRVSQERQKTLDRLRTFKQVCFLLLKSEVFPFFSLINFCLPVCRPPEVPRPGDPEVCSPACVSGQEKRPWEEHGDEQPE